MCQAYHFNFCLRVWDSSIPSNRTEMLVDSTCCPPPSCKEDENPMGNRQEESDTRINISQNDNLSVEHGACNDPPALSPPWKPLSGPQTEESISFLWSLPGALHFLPKSLTQIMYWCHVLQETNESSVRQLQSGQSKDFWTFTDPLR